MNRPERPRDVSPPPVMCVLCLSEPATTTAPKGQPICEGCAELGRALERVAAEPPEVRRRFEAWHAEWARKHGYEPDE